MGVTTYTVSQSREGWEIDRSGTLLGLRSSKDEAIAFATVDAQRAAKSGVTSQVVVVEGITDPEFLATIRPSSDRPR